MKLANLILFIILSVNLSAQNRYDVVIDEIMADPSPQIGLPNNEWIELKNVSTAVINLQGWRIGDASGQSGSMPDYLLQPGSFVIVCTGTAVTALSAFGSVIPVSGFPSLDNDGEQLFLKDVNGVIHSCC
ncbi:MAG: lamin tail domain-containing protein [Bacteroidota bacterium]